MDVEGGALDLAMLAASAGAKLRREIQQKYEAFWGEVAWESWRLSYLVQVAVLDVADIVEEDEGGAGGHGLEQGEVLPPEGILGTCVCADEVTHGAGVHPIGPVVLNEGGDGLPAVSPVHIDPPRVPVPVPRLRLRIFKTPF